ncbi:sulfatase family protein [Haloferula rosea]|uniref:Sulfatase n=1 Tax=Haloferula rosea TaxID=490093 RepID=A0A934VFL8_9BACT|nr:sulfatase [Haloferula rosea]MBK1827191.1 sulfatase [Haloferula rosea]
MLSRLAPTLLLLACHFSIQAETLPNYVIIFTDDQGYNDLGCFGSKTIKTPHIDQLAAEGRKMTNFHVPSSVCSPSRAALMTGCYPKRIGMHKHVIFPNQKHGLHPDEMTIAELLKQKGYATACFGKWHLGHTPELLPTSQGFDEYFGIPYSNDMKHPANKGKPKIPQDESWLKQGETFSAWGTPLIEGTEIVELPVDQRTITRRYTDRAVKFIEDHRDEPFLVYLPHSMPHIPLFVPDDVRDPDPKNAYTCVIEHIDAEVGRITDTLKKLGLDKNTYLIFTSDNGPWLRFKNHGGSALPLREGKGTTYEGGQRVPCVVWGPGRIPAGTSSDAFCTTMDLFPTIAALSSATPGERKTDGHDISKVLHGQSPSPRTEMLYYTSSGELKGLRQGDWKLLLPLARKNAPKHGKVELFNLTEDISESKNLAPEHPEKVEALKSRMTELDAEITRNARPRWSKS